MTAHHAQCDWHYDQYDFECTCGATKPKAEWFDAHARKALIDGLRRSIASHGLTAADLFGAPEDGSQASVQRDGEGAVGEAKGLPTEHNTPPNIPTAETGGEG